MTIKGEYAKIKAPHLRGVFFAYMPSQTREVNWEAGSASIKSGGTEMRVKITLACSECKQRNYDTKKNKKNDPDRLELMKYCRFCRKHTLHKETK